MDSSDAIRTSAIEKLAELRKAANSHPLYILVWGPSNDGSIEYKARCEIRDRLTKDGHEAHFSEDLQKHSEAMKNPLHDEMLQAEVVDAIVMIYGCRGTQTETDTILSRNDIAAKTAVLVSQSVHSNVTQKSLVAENWREMAKHAEIIQYERLPLSEEITRRVLDWIKELRQKVYMRDLYNRGI